MSLPSPFAVEPPERARKAAERLMEDLRGGAVAKATGVDLGGLAQPGRGKMFGVLVARDAEGVERTLRAFSGMLGGKWHVDGFAPPLFEREAYERIWPAAERELRELERKWLGLTDAAARVALEAARTARSHAWWAQILSLYELRNARGESTTVRALYAPDPVPGGAGDCAAPKLLGEAYRRGWSPVAFAEFWWGAPPLTGGRVEGAYYPACRGKCGRVLPWMLQGLDVEAAPEDPDVPGPLRVLHDDAFVIVVDKPAGLPSVPGRFRKERDSVVARLGGGAAQVLHELDVEACGLVVVAKSGDVAVELHRQFGRGELVVTYAAWLDGTIAADGGVVELPLRLDREDRPRRVVDAVRGKRAVTEWRVVERAANGTTRVELTPRTDRTHQLRVHAAHPAGLGAALVGDELYGREPGAGDARLALEATRVTFVHPGTGVRVDLTR